MSHLYRDPNNTEALVARLGSMVWLASSTGNVKIMVNISTHSLFSYNLEAIYVIIFEINFFNVGRGSILLVNKSTMFSFVFLCFTSICPS